MMDVSRFAFSWICSVLMSWMEMAPLGQDWTQAGASPSARRSWQMSHFLTMPRSLLYLGTSYGHLSEQY